MAGIFKAYDVRGIYPEALNREIARGIGRAFIRFSGAKKIAVGRDMRLHSPEIFAGLAQGLTEMGCDVIDLGMCSTPMCYHAVGYLETDGGVMVTASHNPGEWNGMKFCGRGAVPISGDTGLQEIERYYHENAPVPAVTPGRITSYDIAPRYGAFVRSFSRLTRKLKVVCDFANGMGSYEIAGLRDLFEIIPLYETPDGSFPNHEANPLHLETLKTLQAKVVETGADFGAAFDGDADRCGFVDDRGEIIPMDLFTGIVAMGLLRNGPATILYDLRSSRAVRECIEENGGRAVMSRVGHSFIKKQMREENALFAGELSGHYYFRENYVTESQALAMLTLGNLICDTGKSASELAAPLKRYFASGEINSRVDDVPKIIAEIRRRYADGNLFELDGISGEYGSWRFNVRASNTEPLLRLIVEADTPELMAAKRDELLALIRG